jgi:hypothetical protein
MQTITWEISRWDQDKNIYLITNNIYVVKIVNVIR